MRFGIRQQKLCRRPQAVLRTLLGGSAKATGLGGNSLGDCVVLELHGFVSAGADIRSESSYGAARFRGAGPSAGCRALDPF